jgi:hypothetical protein
MMADRDTKQDAELERFFAAARGAPEPASEALLARVLADAQAVQAAESAMAMHRGGAVGRRRRVGVWAALGGWPALGGLALATVAGLWIGFSPTLGGSAAVQSVMGWGSASSDSYLVDYATGYEYAFMDGDAG